MTATKRPILGSHHPDLGSSIPSSRADNDFLRRIEALVGRSVTAIRASKFRRLIMVVAFLTTCSIILWVKVIAPIIQEGRSAWSALKSSSVVADTVNEASHPKFPDMVFVKTLDPALLPQSSTGDASSRSRKTRLIFVGDIHGCRMELEALLKKVQFHSSTDHLISVGDIVSKGPDSLGVIDLLRRCNASCVRGNHDDRLLLTALQLRSKASGTGADNYAGMDSTDESAEATDPVQQLAKSLKAEHLEYLQSCPVILRLGSLEAFNGDAVVVHGGLIPGLALGSQDPVSAMNMRIVDLATRIPSKKHKQKGSVAWYRLWNRYQQLLPVRQRFDNLKGDKGREYEKPVTVVYGHDAKKGLQIHKYTKGLDSGCVNGGKLTALVVEGNGKQKLFQVDGKNYRDGASLPVDVLRDGAPPYPAAEKAG
ncbi:uncharacterized protein Z520_04922 [Fonsecaea multimorphosa CBS 102226]|uniref:Calcineurin-like phosphoesterase domain-containing protein n=1 Tax=Fonsecaea multimorphosa CBS 102226 TaxID=1442371 RepID=A0A0D2IQT9_9EURO|nr:uncharacterized protein Z520_04922 [Fonsecaea multimorphosa CBS 102226]KIX99346.1 hypothetical protein Z520_04922 [Fonsecaea multimorphosa CBS 102226]OAL25677.1 hypothetical protein AYO22_04666 [Fonsecaea multimorphosa]